MYRCVFIFSVFLFLYSNLGFGQEYLGVYVTKPEIFPGFNKPNSHDEKEVIEKTIKRLTVRLEIKENELIIFFGEEDEIDDMKYEVDGNYILATEDDSLIKKFVPFYIEDSETIHGFGSIFFREE